MTSPGVTRSCGPNRRTSADATPVLIVTADDLGLHEDINRGIYLAHTNGIVTSASAVACGEAFDDACAIVTKCPSLDLGVHLTLIEERPLSPPSQIRSLVTRDGRFLPSYRHFAARLLAGSISASEIRRELRAQIERVLTAGRRISHLDGHQHVHVLPTVWRVTMELAAEYGVRWVRKPYFASPLRSRRSIIDPVFRLGLNAVAAIRILQAGRHPGGRVGTPGLHLSGHLTQRDVCEIVSELPPGISELVTHPGIGTAALRRKYRWNYEWSTELEALTAPGLRAMMRERGVALTRFSEC